MIVIFLELKFYTVISLETNLNDKEIRHIR